MHRKLIGLAVVGLLVALRTGTSVGADPNSPYPPLEQHLHPTTYYHPEAIPAPDHNDHRAGWPKHIARLAHPSESPAYIGYLVGGGSPRKGDPPTADDGTWGWDYQGWCLPRRVVLLWYHGRKYQGGIGGYKTDGPKCKE